jgi:hypothetical protein
VQRSWGWRGRGVCRGGRVVLRFRFIESASTNMALIPTILGFMQHAASPPAHLHRNMIIRLHTLIYGLIRLYQACVAVLFELAEFVHFSMREVITSGMLLQWHEHIFSKELSRTFAGLMSVNRSCSLGSVDASTAL